MSTTSGSSRPQDPYKRGCSKSQQRRGPERSLTIGTIPIEAVPKEPMEYPSLGWTRDATHLMNCFLYNEASNLSDEKRAQIILQVLDYMAHHMDEWHFRKEQQPLWYMTYLMDLIKKMGGPTLKEMRKYTLWIKPGSYYHLKVYQQKKLKECPHLLNLDPPK